MKLKVAAGALVFAGILALLAAPADAQTSQTKKRTCLLYTSDAADE